MAESGAILYLTTGQPGSGKTYSRVRWLMNQFMIESSGLYITNFPLNIELISDELSRRTGKPPEDFQRRIVVIPDDVMSSWRSLTEKNSKDLCAKHRKDNTFPPAQYFESFDLNNARIAIDEFHRYFKKGSPADLLSMWNDWFAEIRKLGCTFEAITQELDQLPQEFIGKVGIRVDLLPFSSLRDPFLKIPLSDWYELRAAYTGIREQKICQAEYRKGTSFTGRVKWVQNHVEKFAICKDFFPYYNSYQKTESSGVIGNSEYPADRYKKRTVLWFIRRHFFKLLGKTALVVFFLWLTFGGGLLYLINGFVGTLGKMGAANGAKKQVRQSSAPSPVISSSNGEVVSSDAVPGAPGEGGAVPVVVPPPPDPTPFRPALFYGDVCYLRNGLKIHENYQFTGGIYDGKTVVSFDFEGRSYLLDDGVCVYMF